jgi:hypothetical protein
VSQGNTNTNNIEFYFQKYLKETHDEKVYKLEKCLELNPNWYLPIRDDSSSG